MDILFSIIIPTYNRAVFLPHAIESIIAQTYQNWELLVIDDGSTDTTNEVVSKYTSDKRVRYIYQTNQERSAARNNGIMLSKGDFICFMDSDEYADANRLDFLSAAIKKNYSIDALYYTDIAFEFPNPIDNYVRKGQHFAFPIDPNQLIKVVIGNPQLCGSAEIFRKYKFNNDLSVGEDVELIFRITQEYPLIYIEGKPTIVEIEHENRSVNYNNASNLKQLKTLEVMFARKHPASKVKSELKRTKWSEAYLRACYYFLLNGGFVYSIKYLILSMVNNPFYQIKFKFNLLVHLIFMPTRANKLL